MQNNTWKYKRTKDLVIEAGKHVVAEYGGNGYNCLFLRANDGGSDLLLSVNGSSPEEFPVGESFKSDAGELGRVVLYNESVADITVDYSVSQGEITAAVLLALDELQVSRACNLGETPVQIVAPPDVGDLDNFPPGGIAADSSQREIIVQNNESTAVWIGATAASVSAVSKQGIKIYPNGGSIRLDSSSAWFVYGDGGAGAVNILRNKRA